MRKFVAEFLGTFLLLSAIVGSGVMANNLTDNGALQLLMNAITAVSMLTVIISVFADFSGAHFNPVVSIHAFKQKQLSIYEFLGYLVAQLLGAIAGTLFTNQMFNLTFLQISKSERINQGTFLGEFVATFGLLMVIYARPSKAAVMVPAWIGAAYFFTSSTSFANPAVTVGRIFTDTYAGIAPSSALPFIVAQLLGALILIYVAPKIFKEIK